MEEKQKETIIHLASQIKSYVLTEKTTKLYQEKQQYTFLVDPSLKKTELKLLIELVFSVKVCEIRTLNLPRVTKRVGKFLGKKARAKKVYVTLEKNQKIDNLLY